MLLDLDGEGPLYQQTYRALRRAILEGSLRTGTRLPATRSLARECQLSRNTVLQAYEQLLDEGYLIARQGSGTFVSERLPDALLGVGASPPVPESRASLPAASSPRAGRLPRPGSAAGAAAAAADRADSLTLSAFARRMQEGAPRSGVSWAIRRRPLRYDFRYGEPAYTDLPLETWCRLLGRRARRASVNRLAYGDPMGAPPLRQALADYLRRARGVLCDPEQILITHGSQQAIDLAMRVLVDPGDRIALEEPHYTGFSLATDAYGAERVAIPVDEDGLDVDALVTQSPLRGVCVTPSHQFPIGSILSLERRLELISWAEREGAFVLEDDYDGEYRYDGRPIPSLQGLDRAGRVLYVGTASKMLFPALRIGWLVAPESLIRALGLAKACCDAGGSSLEQLTLADFIEGGQLERHVRRSRVRNAARREALHAAVERHLAGRATLAGTRAGMHGLLWVEGLPAARESELRRGAQERGVGIYPVRPYYSSAPEQAGYVLGYAALSEDDIEAGIERLARALEEL